MCFLFVSSSPAWWCSSFLRFWDRVDKRSPWVGAMATAHVDSGFTARKKNPTREQIVSQTRAVYPKRNIRLKRSILSPATYSKSQGNGTCCSAVCEWVNANHPALLYLSYILVVLLCRVVFFRALPYYALSCCSFCSVLFCRAIILPLSHLCLAWL